jgi:aldose 1-epimerase
VTLSRESWGKTAADESLELFTLEREDLRARLTNFGATLVSLEIPDRDGQLGDVVLGFDSAAGYESADNPYFGGMVGRCANRIACARFDLDGETHLLTANEGLHHLHGGKRGYDRRPWLAQLPQDPEATDALGFHLWSGAGEEGYPGKLKVFVGVALSRDGSLVWNSHATAYAPTIVNLAQHTWFNLAGAGTVLAHELEIAASRYVEVDAELIPTGELPHVAGTPFDFRTPRAIGAEIPVLTRTRSGGYDVCYALDKPLGELGLAARLRDPASGRVVEIHTTEPGLQLYSGNGLDGLVGKRGQVHPRHGGVCLEAQHFPDAVHHPHFPSVVLRPDEPYSQVLLWKFGRE